MKGFVALALGLLLCACTFTSKAPLFDESQGAQPFADGARFVWREPESHDPPMVVRYTRQGAHYLMASEEDADEAPIEALFVRVPHTAREAYIIQTKAHADSQERAYAFMWREGENYLIYSYPGEMDKHASGQYARGHYCITHSYGECEFTTREAALGVYRDFVARTLMAGEAGDELTVQSPLPAADGAEPSP
jgi:hypothetical protein